MRANLSLGFEQVLVCGVGRVRQQFSVEGFDFCVAVAGLALQVGEY